MFRYAKGATCNEILRNTLVSKKSGEGKKKVTKDFCKELREGFCGLG